MDLGGLTNLTHSLVSPVLTRTVMSSARRVITCLGYLICVQVFLNVGLTKETKDY